MSDLKHLAVIMDGNGRWAKERGLNRTKGHEEGLKRTKEIVKSCCDLNIKYLTLYVFSTENWKRMEDEVSFLMDLIVKNLTNEFDFYKENGIRIFHFGNKDGMSKNIQNDIDKTQKFTKDFDKLNLGLCINYGGLDEIKRAHIRAMADNSLEINDYLDTSISKFLPVDFLIRTGKQKRISNFLLSSIAYSEIYFSDVLWPDFKEKHLLEAIEEFNKSKRTFGS